MKLAEKMLQNFKAELVMAIIKGNQAKIVWLKKQIEMLTKEVGK